MEKRQLTKSINLFINPLGFERNGNVWNRRNQYYVDVIDIQNSSGGQFCMNFGVVNNKIHNIVWPKHNSSHYRASDCIIQTRTGDNQRQVQDLWWNYDDNDLEENMKIHINKVIFPFIDKMHCYDNILNWYNINYGSKGLPINRILKFVLLYLMGRHEDCRLLFDALLQNKVISMHLKTFAREVYSRLIVCKCYL